MRENLLSKHPQCPLYVNVKTKPLDFTRDDMPLYAGWKKYQICAETGTWETTKKVTDNNVTNPVSFFDTLKKQTSSRRYQSDSQCCRAS